jgi:hypothetical protein
MQTKLTGGGFGDLLRLRLSLLWISQYDFRLAVVLLSFPGGANEGWHHGSGDRYDGQE